MPVKNPVRSTKNFISKHRVAIAVTLTSAVMFKGMVNQAATHREFLQEHNLFDEYLASLDKS